MPGTQKQTCGNKGAPQSVVATRHLMINKKRLEKEKIDHTTSSLTIYSKKIYEPSNCFLLVGCEKKVGKTPPA